MEKPRSDEDAVSVVSHISRTESFNIKFSRSDDNFPYQKVSFESFDLPPQFHKFSSDVLWTSPSISPFGQYFSVIAINSKLQKSDVYIWEFNHILKSSSLKYSYSFVKTKVLDVIFVSTKKENERKFGIHSFGILTEDRFSYFNMESGNPINITKVDNKITKVIDHEGSLHGKFYMISTPEAVLSFDIINCKKTLNYEDTSPKKFLRNKKCICIENKTAKIISFESGQVSDVVVVELEGIVSHDNILDCMFTSDLQTFYYLTDNGLYEVVLESLTNNFPIHKIIDFESMQETKPVIGELSVVLDKFITSDLRSFTFWIVGQPGKPDMIFRQDCLEAKVSFDSELIVILDPHRINIFYYQIYLDNLNEHNQENNEKQYQSNIWLTPDITSIYSYHFTSDNTLLTIIDQNNAALWDLTNNTLLMKFFGRYEFWNKTVKMAPDESELAIMTTKATENMIQVWDYSNGKELFQLFGFNVFSLSFSSDGYLLAGGAMKGPDIACIWDLENPEGDPVIFTCPQGSDPFYSDKVNVLLCGDALEEMKIICISDKSLNCLVFNYLSRDLYADIPSQYGTKVDFVCELNSTFDGHFFSCISVSSGSSEAYLYSMERKLIFRKYKHCVTLQFGEDGSLFITKTINSQSKQDNKLILWRIEENLRLVPQEVNIDVEENYLLKDNRCLCSVVPNKNEKIFVLTDLMSGKIFGEVIYIEKNTEKKFAVCLEHLDDDTLLLKMFSIQGK